MAAAIEESADGNGAGNDARKQLPRSAEPSNHGTASPHSRRCVSDG